MAKLTLDYILRKIQGDKRFEQAIDLDEIGKAILYTAPGWTWCAADGNRTVEGFLISDENCDGDPCDTVGYFNSRIKMIEKEK